MRSSCKPSASRPFTLRARGLTLLEVMVSQVIGLIIITGMTSLISAMVKKLNAETNVSDAQVKLREVTHLLLRDTQGVGGTVASAGDLFFVTDGGTTGPDQLEIFHRDETVCFGGLLPTGNDAAAGSADGVNLTFDASTSCPLQQPTCANELDDRPVMLMGATQTVVMTKATNKAVGSTCKLQFVPAEQDATVISNFNTRYGTSVANINKLLDAVNPKGVLFGSSFRYRLTGTVLQRSVDGGKVWEDLLDNVYDLQIERVYNVASGSDPVTQVTASTGSALPTGVAETNFIGLRIGIMTFSRAADGMPVAPPSKFSNRLNTLSDAVHKSRRYRGSFVFSAARNRDTL